MNAFAGVNSRNRTELYIVRLGQEISIKPRLADRQPSNRGGVLPVETRPLRRQARVLHKAGPQLKRGSPCIAVVSAPSPEFAHVRFAGSDDHGALCDFTR